MKSIYLFIDDDGDVIEAVAAHNMQEAMDLPGLTGDDFLTCVCLNMKDLTDLINKLVEV